MGLIWTLLLAAAVTGALTAARLARPIWLLVGAALLLGATGYAIQGSPFLQAGETPVRVDRARDDSALIDLRDRMIGRYSLDAAYVTAADAMARNGAPRAAVQVLLGGLDRIPDSLSLWTALGTSFAAHDGDRVTPPARFAFARALRIAPTHPAPPFFLGLAHVQAGDLAAARPWWARAVALSPPGASYRRDLATRLADLDRRIAAGQGRRR